MKLTNARVLIISLIIAAAITLITGLILLVGINYFNLPPPPSVEICFNMNTVMWLSSGFPLPWISYALCGGYKPTLLYNASSFVIDFVLWFIAVAAILFVVKHMKK